MADIITTIEVDAGQLATEIGSFLKQVDQDVVQAWNAILAAYKQGNLAAAFAGALTTVLKDAQSGLATLEKDAAALVPANVKAFVEGTSTLDAEIPAPILGTVTAILWKGDKASLIDALAKGTTQL